jgi:transposase-like protein
VRRFRIAWLEGIKEQRTVNEIASAYSIHPNQVTQWKKQALEQLPEIFSSDRARDQHTAGHCATGCIRKSGS